MLHTCGIGKVGGDVERCIYGSIRERLEVLQQALREVSQATTSELQQLLTSCSCHVLFEQQLEQQLHAVQHMLHIHTQDSAYTACVRFLTACAMTPGLGPIWNTSVNTGTVLESFRKFL